MTPTKWTSCAVEGSLLLHALAGLTGSFRHWIMWDGRSCPSPLTLMLMLMLILPLTLI